jgi:hypothetical protein
MAQENFTYRLIAHPNYLNVSPKEAEAILIKYSQDKNNTANFAFFHKADPTSKTLHQFSHPFQLSFIDKKTGKVRVVDCGISIEGGTVYYRAMMPSWGGKYGSGVAIYFDTVAYLSLERIIEVINAENNSIHLIRPVSIVSFSHRNKKSNDETITFLIKSDLITYMPKSSLPDAISHSPFFWGDLTAAEAQSFIELFPTDKNVLIIRQSSELNCIAITRTKQKQPGGIEHVLLPYFLDDKGICRFTSSLPNGENLTFEELISHCKSSPLFYEVLSREKNLINTSQSSTIQTSLSIKTHATFWQNIDHLSKVFSALPDGKHYIVFVPKADDEEIDVHIQYRDKKTSTTCFQYNEDDNGNSLISIVVDNKAIISDLTPDQLESKFIEWGFTVVKWADAQKIINLPALPDEVKKHPCFWGNLTDTEAIPFINLLPYNIPVMIFHESDKPGYIRITQKIQNTIEQKLLSYKIIGDVECAFSSVVGVVAYSFEKLIEYYQDHYSFKVLSKNVPELVQQPILNPSQYIVHGDTDVDTAEKNIVGGFPVGEKDSLFFYRDKRKNILSVVYMFSDGQLATQQLLMNKDPVTNVWCFSIAINGKVIAADLRFAQLIEKYKEWGFRVLTSEQVMGYANNLKKIRAASSSQQPRQTLGYTPLSSSNQSIFSSSQPQFMQPQPAQYFNTNPILYQVDQNIQNDFCLNNEFANLSLSLCSPASMQPELFSFPTSAAAPPVWIPPLSIQQQPQPLYVSQLLAQPAGTSLPPPQFGPGSASYTQLSQSQRSPLMNFNTQQNNISRQNPQNPPSSLRHNDDYSNGLGHRNAPGAY